MTLPGMLIPCLPLYICRIHHHLPDSSSSCKSHTLLNLRNRQRRIQPLRTRPRTVQNGVTPIQTHTIIQRILPLRRLLVPAVRNPPVRLQQHGGAQVFLRVPPVARARGAAAGAEDALVQPVQLLAVHRRLPVLAAVRGGRVALEVGLDGFVLLVELGQVGDEVFDDVGMGEGVDAGSVAGFGGDAACVSPNESACEL